MLAFTRVKDSIFFKEITKNRKLLFYYCIRKGTHAHCAIVLNCILTPMFEFLLASLALDTLTVDLQSTFKWPVCPQAKHCCFSSQAGSCGIFLWHCFAQCPCSQHLKHLSVDFTSFILCLTGSLSKLRSICLIAVFWSSLFGFISSTARSVTHLLLQNFLENI